MNYSNNKPTKREYDESDPHSIEAYSKKSIGMTFRRILELDLQQVAKESSKKLYGTKNSKGGLGELVERHFFHYEPNNKPTPDFEKAGVELKVTPFKCNKNGSFSAKERLVINMINYMDFVKESFDDSHFWNKAKLLLIMYYLWKDNTDNLNYTIEYSGLFSPPPQDLEIIKNDFKIIQNKVKAGKAHELSCSDTLYIEACPKASTSKDRRTQPYSDVPAKPRAFAFKSSYMTYVLNNYFINDNQDYESIIKKTTCIPFEEYIVNTISKYKDYSVQDLCSMFKISYDNKPKNLGALLAYRILGIKGNKASEFQKANIVVKTIRINKNNTINEHMSFPNFKFTEIVKETWETASIRDYLEKTRFFFIIYKYDKNDILRLQGCQFWNMPYKDLEKEVKSVWCKTRDVINRGIKTTIKNGRTYNNLPSPSDNPVCHVRPHGRNKNDTYELPNGESFTKQCFWLNNSYILNQLDII